LTAGKVSTGADSRLSARLPVRRDEIQEILAATARWPCVGLSPSRAGRSLRYVRLGLRKSAHEQNPNMLEDALGVQWR
jgi:hypothetical protein